MKSNRLAILGLAALMAASCGSPSARIDATIAGASEENMYIKLLDINTFKDLDSLKTDKQGHFTYDVKMQKDQPEFVYIFRGDKKVTALIVEPGDKIRVRTHLDGGIVIEGSPESVKLQEVDEAYVSFVETMKDLYAVAATAGNSTEGVAARKKISDTYIKYYRDRVKFLLKNPYSLSTIPVLYQQVNSTVPVFSQYTDALYFRNACDSLATLYPKSKYVYALGKEAQRREDEFKMSIYLGSAKQSGFPEITLPDVNGQKVALADVDAKVILVYFWSSTATTHKMFNIEALKPIYDAYHSKGLEVYAVSVDPDKASWAGIVKNQNLPWINVNDGLGVDSPALRLYNVQNIPTIYMIVDGEISTVGIGSEKELRSFLDKNLK